jgi:hypothetical protein
MSRSSAPAERADVYTRITTEIIAAIEAGAGMLPFSREVRRLEWLKRSLTVYRLAFGQPRQEDLLEYLHSLMVTAMAAEDLADLQIRLQP